MPAGFLLVPATAALVFIPVPLTLAFPFLFALELILQHSGA
jgi:hypothetical protein